MQMHIPDVIRIEKHAEWILTREILTEKVIFKLDLDHGLGVSEAESLSTPSPAQRHSCEAPEQRNKPPTEKKTDQTSPKRGRQQKTSEGVEPTMSNFNLKLTNQLRHSSPGKVT
jgi:hypothetical protein